jgi:hypothetical protein
MGIVLGISMYNEMISSAIIHWSSAALQGAPIMYINNLLSPIMSVPDDGDRNGLWNVGLFLRIDAADRLWGFLLYIMRELIVNIFFFVQFLEGLWERSIQSFSVIPASGRPQIRGLFHAIYEDTNNVSTFASYRQDYRMLRTNAYKCTPSV